MGSVPALSTLSRKNRPFRPHVRVYSSCPSTAPPLAHTAKLVRSSPTLKVNAYSRAADPGLLYTVTLSTKSELESSYVSVWTWSA